MPESGEAWQRLGEMLEGRRVALNPKYRNLVLFTAERGIDYRLAWDVEHAARTNYRRPTITAIEVAYAWRPGSIRLVLAGGEPAELDIAVTAPASPLTAGEERALASWREEVRLGVEQKRNEGRAPRRNGSGRSA
jgi:hypothetical protein